MSKTIVAGGSGRRFKTSCPVECVRPSDDELARLCSSCDVLVLPFFRKGLSTKDCRWIVGSTQQIS